MPRGGRALRAVRSDHVLRALAGSAAVRDRIAEACDATLALLVCLALRGLGRGGHVARLGRGLVGAPAQGDPHDKHYGGYPEAFHHRPIPSPPHSPECMEKLFGKAKRTPNRDSEGRQEGAKEPRLATSRRRKRSVEKPSALFQTVSPRTPVNRDFKRAGDLSSALLYALILCLTREPTPSRAGASPPRHWGGGWAR
jgi:hypothetical protein